MRLFFFMRLFYRMPGAGATTASHHAKCMAFAPQLRAHPALINTEGTGSVITVVTITRNIPLIPSEPLIEAPRVAHDGLH